MGFHCSGHAGYAKKGRDIVCAAVSVLVINTINGIDSFTEDAFFVETPDAEMDSAINDIDFRLTETVSSETKILLDTLVLGLTEIKKTYGDSYLTLLFEEV